MKSAGWIAVDLDGTLAEYHSKQYPAIGAPIPAMVARVKAWLAEGKDVRIMTARAADAGQISLIEEWCSLHLGWTLRITDRKDFEMIELWDDRAVAVEKNTGRSITEGRS